VADCNSYMPLCIDLKHVFCNFRLCVFTVSLYIVDLRREKNSRNLGFAYCEGMKDVYIIKRNISEIRRSLGG
jgi:hypothetical protein